MNLETFQLKDLTPAEYNPRTITPEALKGLQRSIEEFGYLQPIIVNTHSGNAPTIVGGHQRLKALLAQGKTEAKCVVVDFDTIKEKAANVALNAETISGDWNLEGLETILEELKVEFPEFDEINLDELADSLEIDLDFLGDEDDEKKDADSVPEIEEKPVIKAGDLIELGNRHRVLCGDSTRIVDVETVMGGEKADMVFTDPPYGIGEAGGKNKSRSKKAKAKDYGDKAWDDKIPPKIAFDLMFEWSKDQIIFGGNYFVEYLKNSPCWLVWHKDNGETDFADCELAWTSLKTAVRLYKYRWHGMLQEDMKNKEERFHPTQKPVGLFEAIFNDYQFKTCLDPFLGSGTTLIAAEKTGRRCYGLEIDPGYVQVGVQRWCDFTGEGKVKINGKEVSWSEYRG